MKHKIDLDEFLDALMEARTMIARADALEQTTAARTDQLTQLEAQLASLKKEIDGLSAVRDAGLADIAQTQAACRARSNDDLAAMRVAQEQARAVMAHETAQTKHEMGAMIQHYTAETAAAKQACLLAQQELQRLTDALARVKQDAQQVANLAK